jgi:hypothetical protein
MCRPLLPVISRLQASEEVEGKRLECRVPKTDLLPEFLLVLLSQEAVQDPHSRQKHATGMMQVPSIQIRVQHHERHVAKTLRRSRIGRSPSQGLALGGRSHPRAEIRTLKTMVNVELCINRSRQQPKKVAHNLLNVLRGLPCEPSSSISGLPMDGGQDGLLEGSQVPTDRLVTAAFFAPRGGRSEAQSLDWPPALRTLAGGKMGDHPFPWSPSFSRCAFFPSACCRSAGYSRTLSAALRGL